MAEDSKTLKNGENYDIRHDRKALSVLNHVVTSGHTAEVYIGKYGLVIRDVRRKVAYDQSHEE